MLYGVAGWDGAPLDRRKLCWDGDRLFADFGFADDADGTVPGGCVFGRNHNEIRFGRGGRHMRSGADEAVGESFHAQFDGALKAPAAIDQDMD